MIRLSSPKCTIGSAEGCTLRLRCVGVKPLDCVIFRGSHGTVVRSWSTNNRLNGQDFVDAPLVAGDRLKVGPIELEVLPVTTVASEAPMEETAAIEEIDKAINEIKKAAIDDGKNIDDHVPVDKKMDWKGRLHRAQELVAKAHQDVAQEEDDPAARGLQARVIDHIDKAHHHIDEAIAVVETH